MAGNRMLITSHNYIDKKVMARYNVTCDDL